jgi:membrane-associated phospholipid phosphatase
MPDHSDAVRVSGATVLFLVLWIVIYGGASALSAHVPWSVGVALPGEQHIPLVPLAAPVYVSMGALLLLAPLVLRTWQRVWPLFAVLLVETLAAALVFVLLPVRAEPWIEPEPQGWFMGLADQMNLERNFLPSLHVAYSLTAARAIGEHAPRWLSAVAWAWAVLISLSTLLLRQHYLLDVVAGALLAEMSWRLVKPRASRSILGRPEG